MVLLLLVCALPATLGVVLLIAAAAQRGGAGDDRPESVPGLNPEPLGTGPPGLEVVPDGNRGAVAVSRLIAPLAPAAPLPAAALAVTGAGFAPGAGALARPLLLVAALICTATLVTTTRLRTTRGDRLSALVLLCLAAHGLLLLATDLAQVLVACVGTTLAVTALIRTGPSAASARAARVYLVVTGAGDLAVAGALALILRSGGWRLSEVPQVVAGSAQVVPIVCLLLLGFGVRACVFPVHGWLPLVESRSSVPVGAVLSGMVVSTGLIGWIRLLPLGETALPGWGSALVGLALTGSFLVVLPALLDPDPEISLGYSTVSQLGFVTVLIGAALAMPELAEACVLSAVVYAVHHAMAKGGLILAVSIWERHGASRVRWWVLGGSALLALAVVGAPLGSGAVAKYAAKRTLSEAPFVLDVVGALPFISTGSTLLLIWAALTLRRHLRPGPVGVDLDLLVWTGFCLGGTVLTWVLVARWVPVLSVPSLDLVTVWQATWLVLLGLGLAGVGLLAVRTGLVGRLPRGRRLPRGDLMALLERALHRR